MFPAGWPESLPPFEPQAVRRSPAATSGAEHRRALVVLVFTVSLLVVREPKARLIARETVLSRHFDEEKCRSKT
ncbi:hypothetical protein GCM10010260_38320 [Streptomyces filipinensis]|uniref:Uncharacterized protein n=1 Tax=Streptomyces filipinensis TaxID=66887 RepID=A0A918MCC4_9ACTN|nr:hypothetical protein GCM10010260_38320 [Streptomyces filipinensis]